MAGQEKEKRLRGTGMLVDQPGKEVLNVIQPMPLARLGFLF